MANMFFAGIPLEGSGARPLEADLYGAEQQGVDHENLSATGNLNIGNVINYDEHVQRYLNGGAKPGEPVQFSSLSDPGDKIALPDDKTPQRGGTVNDFSPEAERAYNNFPSQNAQAPRVAAVPTPSPSAQPQGPNAVSTATNSQSSSESHETIHTRDGDGDTIINNTYNNNNQNINNVTNNETNNTQSNYGDHNVTLINAPHTVTIGDITIGGGEGGGIINNVLNNVNISEISLVNNVLNNVLNDIGGGDNTILSNILNGNDIDILNGNTLVDIAGNTLNLANNLLNIGGNTVNILSDNLNNVLSGNNIGVVTNVATELLDNVAVNVSDIGNTIIAPAVDVVTNILDGNALGGVITGDGLRADDDEYFVAD